MANVAVTLQTGSCCRFYPYSIVGASFSAGLSTLRSTVGAAEHGRWMQSVSEELRERQCLQLVSARPLRRDHAGRIEQGIIARSSNNRTFEQAGRRVRANGPRTALRALALAHARYTRNRSAKSNSKAIAVAQSGTRALGFPLSGQPRRQRCDFLIQYC